MYHPELYPELAEFNPSPTIFEVTKNKKTNNKKPQKLSCSAVPSPDLTTGFIDVSRSLNADSFDNYRGFAYDFINSKEVEQFREEVGLSFKKTMNIRIVKPSVIYSSDH